MRGGWINQDFRRNNMIVSDVLGAVGKEVVDFLIHAWNFDMFVGAGGAVWMHDDQTHAGDAFPILVFQDFAVNIQLQAIVIVVGIGQMGQERSRSGLVPKRFVLDAFAAFPVVDLNTIGVAFGIGLEDHVDGSCEHVFFIEDDPFGAVSDEIRIIPDKLAKIPEFDAVVVDGLFIVIRFYVGVHDGARPRCDAAIFGPRRDDLVFGHAVIFVGGIVAFGGMIRTFLGDGLGVEMREILMHQGRDRRVSLFSIDGIEMGAFLERNIGIPRVGILFGEKFGGCRSHCGDWVDRREV